MADQAYLDWPHELVASGALRTPMQRATDVFNIRDYYHTADSTDWQPAIQRAVDAAIVAGGTVFFPPGVYALSRRIYIGASGGNIKLVGCGGTADGSQGTILSMSVRDYIIYGSMAGTHGFNISLIEGIAFKNSYTGADPINIEPPNTDITTSVLGTSAGTASRVRVACATFIGVPGAFGLNFTVGLSVKITGNSGTTDGTYVISAVSAGNWIELTGTTYPGAWTNTGTVAFSGNGCGCVYIGGAIGTAIRNCSFNMGTGVGYFMGGFQGSVENCVFQGGYGGPPASAYNSFGIMSRSLHIRDGKIAAFGHGIAMFTGMSRAEFLDIENCGIGILVGQIPVAYYDSNLDSNLQAAGSPGGVCAQPGVVLDHIVMESERVTFIKLQNCYGRISNISIQSYNGATDYGLECSGAGFMDFYRVTAGGNFGIAAINVPGAQNCTFRYCSADQTGGAGVGWILPTIQLTGTLEWYACTGYGAGHVALDGTFALPLAVLPPSAIIGHQMMCSDSNAPAWTGTVSNVGKPITGSGSNKVLARWNGTAWAIAG